MSSRKPDSQPTVHNWRVLPRSPSEALEPVRPPRPRGGRLRRPPGKYSAGVRAADGLLTFSTILLGMLGMLTVLFYSELQRLGPLTENKLTVVKKGEGARDIAQRLEAEGIISSQHVFIAYYVGRQLATWLGEKPLQLKAGDYEIAAGATMQEVMGTLGEGKAILYRLTVPEGLTSHQIVERLKADQSLTGDVTSMPAEGSLFPNTYKFARGMTRQGLIETMQAEQRRAVERAWAARKSDLPLKSPQEAVILASIIEKETGRKDERNRVAAVFVNRLKKGMRLESDPTILYGISGGDVAWGRPILKSEIDQKTAHNTYKIPGLPSTPICNPGRASLEAALNPSSSNDIFFVADGKGGHVFSQSHKEHEAAVARWRLIEKEYRAQQAAKQAEAKTRAVVRAVPSEAPNQVPAVKPAAPVNPVTTVATPADQAPAPPAQKPAANPVTPVPAPASPPEAAPAAASEDVPLPVRKPKR